MTHANTIQVKIFDYQGNYPIALINNPRKLTIKSGYGAGKKRCWLELYNEDLWIPSDLGLFLEIWISQSRCFRGRITQRRIDSIDDHLSLYAEWEPEKEYKCKVGGYFEFLSPTQILDDLLTNTNLSRFPQIEHPIQYSALEFADDNIFPAIDFLAKLCGNWYWDVTDDAELSFRPPSPYPDHYVTLIDDCYALNIWETNRDTAVQVQIHGGINDGGTYESIVTIPNRFYTAEVDTMRIYVRAVVSIDSIASLQKSIENQLSRPHYEHFIDLIGYGENIKPGDTVMFRNIDLPGFPQNSIFRVKTREIHYAHNQLKVRLYLTTGFESTSSYFQYFREEKPLLPAFAEGRVGQFQLDLSALNSRAYIDSETL